MLSVTPAGRPRLALHYVHGDDIGYGRVGAALAGALRERGVDVDDVTRPERAHHPPGVAVWLSSPFHASGAWSGQRSVLISMWETDVLPMSFRRSLRPFDAVVVPSAENHALFSAHHPNVHRMKFGVDAGRWSPGARRSPARGFKFLVAGTGRRKGIDLAHEAFRLAFPDPDRTEPRPQLVIKGLRNEHLADGDVLVVGGTLSAGAERELYRSVHCYVQPSRGEGFGLQPLQAIGMGIPTILTDAHGHRAYAHLGIGLPARQVPADLFVFGECGSWWEVDPRRLADSMRWVHANYRRALAAAEVAAARAARELTWERSAEELLAILGGERALTSSLAPRTEWRPYPVPTYRVVTRRDITVPMAGGDHAFVAGREHFAPAQVKRLLFEGGALDHSCLDVPLRRLDATELAALSPARRAEYLDWVVEAKRVPPRLARAAQTAS